MAKQYGTNTGRDPVGSGLKPPRGPVNPLLKMQYTTYYCEAYLDGGQ